MVTKNRHQLRTYISDIGIFLPERKVSSLEVERIVNKNGNLLAEGAIERLFGVKERRYAAAGTQASDLGANAARNIVEKHGAATIDCMIFASASSDLIEPATANIVQEKLGLHCPVFDVKNACNSFVTALQIASSFIDAGIHKKILITSVEKLSNSILFNPVDEEDMKKRLASLSFGDAGTAVMLEGSPNGCGLYFQKFKTVGKHWDLSTIRGGGSMHPFETDKNYFEGKTSELANVFITEGTSFIQSCFREAGWNLDEIDHVVTHQVSLKTFEILAETSGFPVHKMIQVCDLFGNTASASIPLSLFMAEKEGLLKHGDKIVIIGLAAGISISIQLMVWK
jgi:3-oxoacyl-[acyl-carrier-protein] synthase-3